MRHSSFFLLTLVLSNQVACASSDPSTGGDVGEAESDLASRVPLLGSIGYDETYGPLAGRTRYRALHFAGAAGDPIRISVRSGVCPSRVRLLGDRGEVIAQADSPTDGNDDATEAELSATLPESGDYSIAFRALCTRSCETEITLHGPPPITDPFDDRSCLGPPLGLDEIATRLGDAPSIDLGRVQVLSRSRECSSSGGCGAWQADTNFSFVRIAGRPALPYAWSAPLSGVAQLGHSEVGSSLALQIRSDDAVTTDATSNVDLMRVECSNGLGTERTSCRSWAEYRRNGRIGGDMAPTILVGEGRSGFSGVVTERCLRLSAVGAFSQGATRRENQVVIFGKY